MSNNIRQKMLEKTAGVRSTADRTPDRSRTSGPAETAPGLAAALATAQLRVKELEANGAQSTVLVAEVGTNPWQPRRRFNEAKMAELAESIREVGLMQPIVIRRVESGYQIVAGERRWRAHKMLGMESIKAVIVECSDEDMAILALVENIGREGLSDYEIALSVTGTMKEFPNRKRLAEALGLSRSGLYRYLAFDKLPDFMLEDLDLNPTLLGGTAAEAVGSVLKKLGEDGLAAARELWPSVRDGILDQTKFAAAIGAHLNRRAGSSGATGRSIDKFFSGKDQAGSITSDGSGLTVKLKAGKYTEAQETQLRQLIAELFHANPKAS